MCSNIVAFAKQQQNRSHVSIQINRFCHNFWANNFIITAVTVLPTHTVPLSVGATEETKYTTASL